MLEDESVYNILFQFSDVMERFSWARVRVVCWSQCYI